jgi:hypothetical protein
MSIKFTRYAKPLTRDLEDILEATKLTSSDVSILEKLTEESSSHSSGGSYNMLARWFKGSRAITGKNRLDRPASTMNDDYPDVCGVHAELDLFYRLPNIKGGTIYIAGTRAKTGAIMPNTMPCIYCHTILNETNIRYLVYYENGEPIKRQIIKHYNYTRF